MPKDTGSGKVHDCHMTGMVVGSAAECAAKHDECLAACAAIPDPSDGGAVGTGIHCGDAS